MKQLLMKELRLALHPINYLFLLMSAMLLIPNYPHYVTFFYTTLGVFFLCLFGRENNDVTYTLHLPVGRKKLVQARLLTAVLVELTQMLVCIPFALISRAMYMSQAAELAGVDKLASLFTGGQMNVTIMKMYFLGAPNVAFFGLSFVMLGLFNLTFFPLYYCDPAKVGISFVVASVVEALFVVLVTLAVVNSIGFFGLLRTVDPADLGGKVIMLIVGIAAFAGMTLAACQLSAKRFEQIDL